MSMRTLDDFGLSDGDLDDILPFWRFGEERRAVITGDYSASRHYLDRVLSRYFGGRSLGIEVSLTKLQAAGEVLPVSLGAHAWG